MAFPPHRLLSRLLELYGAGKVSAEEFFSAPEMQRLMSEEMRLMVPIAPKPRGAFTVSFAPPGDSPEVHQLKTELKLAALTIETGMALKQEEKLVALAQEKIEASINGKMVELTGVSLGSQTLTLPPASQLRAGHAVVINSPRAQQPRPLDGALTAVALARFRHLPK